jgi:hypothetical protein
MFAGFDDPAAIYILTAAIGFTSPTATWGSHGSKANFSIAQCERKKERPAANGMEAGRQGPVSGRR